MPNKRGETALLRAVARGNETMARRLAEQGASVHTVDGYGNNAMHLACIENSQSMALFLLDKGINLMAKNKDGKKPLALASRELALAVTDRIPNE